VTDDLAARGKALAESGIYLPTNGQYPDDPGPAEPPRDETDQADEPTTWEPVDLGPYLRGEVQQPQPTIGVRRSDGLQLIYPGKEHVFVGETESGKTWFALACVAAELSAGRYVVYVHYEEGNPASTIERLQLLGVGAELITERLRFVAPARAARTEWIAALLDPAPTLVIHDGVNEAMSLIGADIMAADGAAAFRRRLVVPFLAVGAASIACDHLPKDRESRGRDAYGSVHKGNALDGARILLETKNPFGRRMRGVSYVFVTKDRPGQLRAQGRPTKLPGKTYIGSLVVDDTNPFEPFLVMFYAPKDDDQATDDDQADEMAQTVWEVIAAQPDRSVPSLRMLFAALRSAGYQFTNTRVRDTVDDLLAKNRLAEVTGKNRALGYRAVLSASDEQQE
jgi:hypothetical protein